MKAAAATAKISRPPRPVLSPSDYSSSPLGQPRFSPGDIREQVEKIGKSRVFATSGQNQLLLALVAEQYLKDPDTPVTQQAIAKSVLKRDNFDHSSESTVRVAVERFRGRLREYYSTEGKLDEIVFTLPKGRYRLDVHRRRTLETNHPNEEFAFLKYREGRMYWEQRTPDALVKALCCLNEAIGLKPDYAAAHAAIAECYLFMIVVGAEPRKFMAPARRSAERALQVDENSAEGHAVLGAALSHYYRDWKRATAEFERALEIDPVCITAHCWYAPHLVILGRAKDAVKQVRRAQAAYPHFVPVVEAQAAKIFYVCGEQEAALEVLERINVYQPDWYQTNFFRGLARSARGELDLAIADVERATTQCPFQPSMVSALAYLYAQAGRGSDAQRCLDELIAQQRAAYVPAVDFAIAYNAVNNTEAAFAWLEKAGAERSLFFNWLDYWPPLKALDKDKDPRFAAARRRLRLPG